MERKREPAGNVVMHSEPSLWMALGKDIKKPVVKKGWRYKEIDLPLIVAVNATSRFADDEDIPYGLFGTPRITLRTHKDGREETFEDQNPDGAFFGEKPQYKNINAVAVFSRFSVFGIDQCKVSLFHHPWASRPLPLDTLLISQNIPNMDKGEFKTSIGEPLVRLMNAITDPKVSK